MLQKAGAQAQGGGFNPMLDGQGPASQLQLPLPGQQGAVNGQVPGVGLGPGVGPVVAPQLSPGSGFILQQHAGQQQMHGPQQHQLNQQAGQFLLNQLQRGVPQGGPQQQQQPPPQQLMQGWPQQGQQQGAVRTSGCQECQAGPLLASWACRTGRVRWPAVSCHQCANTAGACCLDPLPPGLVYAPSGCPVSSRQSPSAEQHHAARAAALPWTPGHCC